jgi:manganese/zinc/iron transport system substrate-binding protein
VAERIRDALVEQDPANVDSYRERAEAYLAEMRAMDDYAREQIATIPEEARLLVTAHDAFGYFGDAYDMDVMGIQGISTAGEYGLQDLNRVVDIIVDRKVKAVFVETSISPKSIEALVEGVRAKGHEVAIGGDLYSDAMGAEGTPEGTYLGMVKHNVDTIVDALR